MSTSYPFLFSECKIGKILLKNRIVMAPMGTHLQNKNGFVTNALLRYLERRAQGGAAMIIVQFASVVSGQPTLGIYSDAHIPGLKRLARVIHKHDCHAIIQLSHLGAFDPAFPVASTALASPLYPCVPRALSLPEIETLKQAFLNAAKRACEAGFDGVEIHGGYSYMLASFYSPHLNQRKDSYGGTFANRIRLIMDILQSIRQNFPELVIGFKINVHEHVDGGISVLEAARIARCLAGAGLDYIHVVTSHPLSSPCAYPEVSSCYDLNATRNLASLASTIKKHVHLPVLLPAGFSDPETAEEILNSKQADVIVIGRQLIADPNWPNKVEKGIEYCPCIQCNICHIREVIQGKPVRCSVNPEAGREYLLCRSQKKVMPRKRLVVIGAGPAGLSAALYAFKRRYDVILLEKTASLGGNLRLAALPPFKIRLRKFLNYLLNEVSKTAIEIHLETEASPENIFAFNPDAIIVATGAEPIIPNIPGLSTIEYVSAVEFLNHLDKNPEYFCTDFYIIIGAGRIGVELALFLRSLGSEVTLIEAKPYEQVLCDEHPYNRAILLAQLREKGVRFICHSTVVSVSPQEIKLCDEARNVSTLPSGKVIFATGMKKNEELITMLQRHAEEKRKKYRIIAIGDCKMPGNIYTAIHDAFTAIINIENGDIKE